MYKVGESLNHYLSKGNSLNQCSVLGRDPQFVWDAESARRRSVTVAHNSILDRSYLQETPKRPNAQLELPVCVDAQSIHYGRGYGVLLEKHLMLPDLN